MKIRAAKLEDYNQIKELVNRYNLNIYEKSYWQDIWKKNPLVLEDKIDWIYGWVFENGGKIVGHVSNIPTQYYLNNKKYIGAVISCWVVDSEYRFEALKLFQKFDSQTNIDFLIATTSSYATSKTLEAFDWKKMPNENYIKKLNFIFNPKSVLEAYLEKNLKFLKIFTQIINFFVKIIFYNRFKNWNSLKFKKDIEIQHNFNNFFNVFWDELKIKKKKIFLFNRHSKWLNWHLNYQIDKKNCLIIVKKQNNKIVGYAICIYKYDKRLKIKKSILIDLMLIEENDQIYQDLISSSINASKQANCDLFQITGFDDKKRDIFLKFKPFMTKTKFMPFYFKTKNEELKSFLSTREVWDPSELDGDSII